MKRIILYLNQFFGQVGGEDKAGMHPEIHAKAFGPGLLYNSLLKEGEVVKTILCGDNFYAENIESTRVKIISWIKKEKADLFIAGPAFNAGRYGMACGDLCQAVQKELGIPALTGLYHENPAVEIYKRDLLVVETGKSAASMRKAVTQMARIADKLISGERIGTPDEEGLIPMGKRENVFKDKPASKRALEMLLHKMKGEEYKTEIEISVYDAVPPAPAIKNLSEATIALLTSGGIVPFGNPDHMPAATAKFFKKYSIEGLERLEGGVFESIHAGYDPVYCNQNPNRVAPLDLLRKKEKEGVFKKLYPYMYSVSGNSTSVADSTRMGKEIALELVGNGVYGAILTST